MDGSVAELTVLGVDGCPGGWIAARVTARYTESGPAAHDVEWLALPDARALLAAAAGTAVAAVDMPIGLPDAGPRGCDVAARRLLGRRGCCVFPAPVRAVLGAGSHAQACARSRAATGRALPVQAWHLVPRIADLDAHLTPALQDRVVEAHPELAFALMAGAPLPSKRTADGGAERIRALSSWLPDAAATVAAAPRPARRDDAADALACAWVALRRAAGRATVLPAVPEYDRTGLRMEIVA